MALRASEERFRNLYRKAPVPLHALDGNGQIEHVSNAWLELLGYARGEVVGRPIADFMAPDCSFPAGGAASFECRFVAKSDDVLDVILSTRPERNEEGGVMLLGGLVDVTARRKAEEALRQSQKIEAVGKLTGGVAHDFNNLLAVVLGNLELLRKHLPAETKAASLLDNATHAARRGATLTERMLSFARRQDLKPGPVDVPELVRGMGDLLQRSIGPMIAITTHFPLGLARIQADANQLELALLNLVVNARDAMPDGKGSIAISARERIIADSDRSGLAAGTYVCLAVSDNGKGMDAQTLEKAMEPFFTTKGVGKGTGLGLSMVHGLAAQSGGQLVLESREGEGTKAEIWLPAGEPQSSKKLPEVAVAPASDIKLNPLTVLLVDDDALVLSGIAAMLEDLGHQVVAAPSAAQALAVLRSGAIVDLVLTDLAMPGTSGVQLASDIGAAWPSLPIILMTGFSEIPIDSDLVKLRKPFSQQELGQALAACVGAEHAAMNVLTFPQRAGRAN
jgi:signal transduction histidine kinase/ActR/RegA family two-component response regulator